ncbi:MAG: Na+/H+ antiporter NhaA [Propionibacteriaceae bacterium]|nr:Na+/H+ antiporter NhaA [Propionibacteriaceae bacterium]
MSGPDTVLRPGSWAEYSRVRRILDKEVTSGALLLLAAVAAMVLANTVPGFYFGLRDFHLGGELAGLDFNLTVGEWAQDGLLAIFFFLVGLELKREFAAGDLHDPKTAVVPIVAAFGGVVGPALIYTAICWGDAQALRGWAVPVATDIAFAVGVLALVGSHLPAALRTFLLTLAVTDDLIGIAIIAIVYASGLQLWFLLASAVPILAFWYLTQFQRRFLRRHKAAGVAILAVLAVLAWGLFFHSGIHATIAGVVLGFVVPVGANGRGAGLAQAMEDRVRPVSGLLAAPVFAFFASGVALGGWEGVVASATSDIGLGVIVGMPVGKAIGIFGSTWLVTRLKHARLDPDVKWIDLLGLSVLGGMGFTVALLVCELSFADNQAHLEDGKVAILAASLLSAVIAGAMLRARSRHYKAVAEREAVDENADGVPDVFQREG